MDLAEQDRCRPQRDAQGAGTPCERKPKPTHRAPSRNSATDAVLSLEDDVKENTGSLDEEHVPWWRSTEVLTPQALMAIGVVVLMITAVFVFRPTWLGFSPSYEYDLIDYDAAQTRAFAEDLVALGHPEWEGRMSGTVEEANTSAYIAAQFEAMGMTATEHSYQVPMHHVNSGAESRICIQGLGGNSPVRRIWFNWKPNYPVPASY